MKITFKITNSGVSLITGEDSDAAPQRSKTADQLKPQKYYVYAHIDVAGNVFFIGKGIGRRAWEKGRHPFWQRYIDSRSDGKYVIEILNDNLTEEEAIDLESEWIAHYSKTLVNWDNAGRETNFQALDDFHQKRNSNKALIAKAKASEKESPEKAIQLYLFAIDAIDSYVTIKYETGLVADLLEEESREIGQFGEVEAIERLVMCLLKLKRLDEAFLRAENYFNKYRGDCNRAAFERTNRRLKKALNKELTIVTGGITNG